MPPSALTRALADDRALSPRRNQQRGCCVRWDAVTITVGSREGSKEGPCTADDAERWETVSLPAEAQPQEVTTTRLITPDGASHTSSVGTRG